MLTFHFKNAKNVPFWRVFENLQLAVKQCYQKMSILIRQKLMENATYLVQMRHFGNFQTMYANF